MENLKDQKIMNNKISETDGLEKLREICEAGYKNGKNKEILIENLRFTNVTDKKTHPKHEKCAGYYKECNTENREKSICRCMYYYDENKKKCNTSCKFKRKWHHLNDGIDIIDYETPMEYKIKEIGNIDLRIRYEGKEYGVEVKPPEGNEETISRMIAEAMTYTIDFQCEPAIAVFGPSSDYSFEGSYQYKKIHELWDNEDFKEIRKYVKVFEINIDKERDVETGKVVDFIIKPLG